MFNRFYSSMRAHLRGYNIGLKPDAHLLGTVPHYKNREQRRAEKFGK